MIGDGQILLPDSATKPWHKSPSLSSATTDEDFTIAGSPKQRWADLSEEDDDYTTLEQHRFGSYTYDGQDGEHDSSAECALEKNNPGRDDKAHKKLGDIAIGSMEKFFKEEHNAFSGNEVHQNLGRFQERKQGGDIPQFAMLPPCVENPANWTSQGSILHSPSWSDDAPRSAVDAEVFVVVMSGIPAKLCNDACLDAILWASGVQRSAIGYHTEKNGKVVMNFPTLEAATHCYNHFKACSWSTGKLRVDVVLPKSHHVSEGSRRVKQDHKKFAVNNQTPQYNKKQAKSAANLQLMW
jgi:hypothetical protein